MSNFKIKRVGSRIVNLDKVQPQTTPVINNQINKKDASEELFKPFKNSRERKIVKKWEKITGKDDVIISFVSDPIGSNFYSEKFTELVNKVDSLGYDYIFCHYESDRNYFQNCCYKPYFIQSMLNSTKKNVLWIDGDTFLKTNLSQLTDKNKSFDLGLVSYSNSMDCFVASPVYFSNTEVTNLIVNQWESHCTGRVERGECELDHDALKHSILPYYRDRVRINLCGSNLHKGENLENVNSDVPNKREILLKMRAVNMNRPFPGNVTNYNLV